LYPLSSTPLKPVPSLLTIILPLVFFLFHLSLSFPFFSLFSFLLSSPYSFLSFYLFVFYFIVLLCNLCVYLRMYVCAYLATLFPYGYNTKIRVCRQMIKSSMSKINIQYAFDKKISKVEKRPPLAMFPAHTQTQTHRHRHTHTHTHTHTHMPLLYCRSLLYTSGRGLCHFSGLVCDLVGWSVICY